jgi:hypothetical protein
MADPTNRPESVKEIELKLQQNAVSSPDISPMYASKFIPRRGGG